MPKLAQNATGRKLSRKATAVTPGVYFELIAHQTSGATKNVAADELTWFAIESEWP